MKRMHMLISGRVQGVGFRFFVESRARSLGLVGFVRNTADGGVEVVAEGDADSLLTLHELCEKGPRSARVEGLKVTYDNASGEFSEFGFA